LQIHTLVSLSIMSWLMFCSIDYPPSIISIYTIYITKVMLHMKKLFHFTLLPLNSTYHICHRNSLLLSRSHLF
jgi:hypothetical protein